MSKNLEVSALIMAGTLYGALHLNSILVNTFPNQFEGVLPTSKGLKSDLAFSLGMTGTVYVGIKTIQYLR